eukprot:CAMPEP_0184082532 /NCGR_PEP_ID=MMETSP0974-20121125/3253_1 /TAXON_ID=483370 /ORGANISM="non described non described, Strain CCMP2097" /LENGTH=398 /DNA_ID=CAMNT_0026385207 /DNA_START=39 /DNA_END=1235 /DNA_ORIENTATION=-
MLVVAAALRSVGALVTRASPLGVRRVARATTRQFASMGLKTGIVGLPNVGKSTLFNALTEDTNAEAANYPFCTIEPNIGIVTVPDERLTVLAGIHASVKTVATVLEFVDIAGLVKGASKGEGLGNQFLATIRECDAIVHVVRCFEDENVIHVDGTVDPLRDIDVIEIELGLTDIAQLERRRQRALKERKQDECDTIDRVIAELNDGSQMRFITVSDKEREMIKPLNLLTDKPVIYVCNVADGDLAAGNALVDKVREFVGTRHNERVVVASAQVEAELVSLTPEERTEFLESLGVTIEGCGLRAVVRAAYDTLGLITYFTSGPTETRAWTIRQGWKAPQAAGVIHGDFERGFIKAETIGYEDLKTSGDERKAKDAGLMRQEGKEYVVKDGDVMLFRFNV